MFTLTGAWSRVAPGGVLSKVMVTVTVGVLFDPPPLEAHGDTSAGAGAPAPLPLPFGQVATSPTVAHPAADAGGAVG